MGWRGLVGWTPAPATDVGHRPELHGLRAPAREVTASALFVENWQLAADAVDSPPPTRPPWRP